MVDTTSHPEFPWQSQQLPYEVTSGGLAPPTAAVFLAFDTGSGSKLPYLTHCLPVVVRCEGDQRSSSVLHREA